MTTTRSYRGARSIEDAIVELRRCAGTQFDPAMVEALVRALAEHPLGARGCAAVHGTRRGAGLRPGASGPTTTTTPPSNLIEEAGMSDLRRRLEDSASMGSVVVIAPAASLLAVAAVAATSGHFVQPGIAVAFGAFIACGELARITLPGGRDAAPIATAGALGYVLLTTFAARRPASCRDGAQRPAGGRRRGRGHAGRRGAARGDPAGAVAGQHGSPAAHDRDRGSRLPRHRPRVGRSPRSATRRRRSSSSASCWRHSSSTRSSRRRCGPALTAHRSGPTCATSCRPRWASARPSAPPAR